MICTIEKLSHEGRGITHINDKITFVDGALPNEQVEIEYTRKRGKFDEAKVVNIIAASADRTTPLCPHFNMCGGCALQHIKPSKQLELKQAILLEQLQHFGQITPRNILPAIQGDAFGYRRKARLSVRYVAKKGLALVGFRETNGRFVADIQQCAILHPPLDKMIMPLRQLVTALDANRAIPQIEVAVSEDKTALIFRLMQALSDHDAELLINFAKQHAIELFIQPNKPEKLYRLFPTSSSELLIYPLPDHQLEFAFAPTDFTQVNWQINRQMINQALSLLALSPQDHVLDLFCGLGNFTLPIAKQAQHVVGVEGEAYLVARAQANAAKNQIHNVAFHQANLFADCREQAWLNNNYHKVLLDPPRSGAAEIIPQLGALRLERIVYISCNPATFARDAGLLAEHGYYLESVGILDMFPQTRHVETMGLFLKTTN
jgi:23S rRNA (uracil1939-C5)-methyltransferase